MRLRRALTALAAGVVVACGSVLAFSPSGAAAVACSPAIWAEGVSYTAGQQVT